ncbi:MAG: NifU family protein [Alphaproteobacteria bacterium]|jgi:Fe-S cluster biogenesis protein NfuA|nr:NifU family protein [Alphaproteobacteria bacterium]
MFIQTDTTPNPEVLKFIPGRTVIGDAGRVREFHNPQEAQASGLARAIFTVEGVKRVFFARDFLTVTKDEAQDWSYLKAPILAAIMDHYTTGDADEAPFEAGTAADPADDRVYSAEAAEIVQEIKDLLDTRVRPAVAEDGGDILFSHFEPDTGVVWLHMRGACAGCPSSAATLKAGVENLIRHYIPEVTAVEQAL